MVNVAALVLVGGGSLLIHSALTAASPLADLRGIWRTGKVAAVGTGTAAGLPASVTAGTTGGVPNSVLTAGIAGPGGLADQLANPGGSAGSGAGPFPASSPRP